MEDVDAEWMERVEERRTEEDIGAGATFTITP